jgi:hypothetical protein
VARARPRVCGSGARASAANAEPASGAEETGVAKFHNMLFEWCLRKTRVRAPRPLKLASAVIGQQLSSEHCFRFEQLRVLETAFAFLTNEKIAGDYAEFGVFRGDTFAAAFQAAGRWGNAAMRFHAFDSFAGLPDLEARDAGGPFQAGQFSATRASFESKLKINRVDLSRVTITEGFFDETLTEARREEIGLRQVAIAVVDCDLYSSTVPVLRFLSDVLVDGAILIFDDWYCFKSSPQHGEQRACREWLLEQPGLRLAEYRSFHWSGQSFIVQRPGRDVDEPLCREQDAREDHRTTSDTVVTGG